MFEVKESQLVDAALLSLHVYVCGNIQQKQQQQTTANDAWYFEQM